MFNEHIVTKKGYACFVPLVYCVVSFFCCRICLMLITVVIKLKLCICFPEMLLCCKFYYISHYHISFSGYIDLSKRRVSAEEVKKCEEKFTRGKTVCFGLEP